MEQVDVNAETETAASGPKQDPRVAAASEADTADWTTIGWFADGEHDFSAEELAGLERWGCFVPQAIQFWS